MERYSNIPLKQLLLAKNAAGLNFNFDFAKYPPCIADVAEKAMQVCDAVTDYALNKWSSSVSDWKALNGSSLDVALKLAEDLQNGNHGYLEPYRASFSFESVAGIHPSPSGGMTNPSVAKELFSGTLRVRFYLSGGTTPSHLSYEVVLRLDGSGIQSRVNDKHSPVRKFILDDGAYLKGTLSRFSEGPVDLRFMAGAESLLKGALKCKSPSSSLSLEITSSPRATFDDLFESTSPPAPPGWIYTNPHKNEEDILVYDEDSQWVVSLYDTMTDDGYSGAYDDLEEAKELARQLALNLKEGTEIGEEWLRSNGFEKDS
jgi:hypothetical protein